MAQLIDWQLRSTARVCGISLVLLAMTFGNFSPLLAWTNYRSRAGHAADDQLREQLAALEEGRRIDLVNFAMDC